MSKFGAIRFAETYADCSAPSAFNGLLMFRDYGHISFGEGKILLQYTKPSLFAHNVEVNNTAAL